VNSDKRLMEMPDAILEEVKELKANSKILNYPNTIIIDTADIMRQYSEMLHGIIDRRDYGELMAQLIQVLLNSVPENLDAKDFPFPEFSRLRYTKLRNGTRELTEAIDACTWLLEAIIGKLGTYKAFVDDDFPYYFDRFTGDDIVLQRLPY